MIKRSQVMNSQKVLV